LKKEGVGEQKRNEWKVWIEITATCNMQFLEYNLTRNNVEGICNVYLEHHPIKVNI
jgi:hypothetical protein